MGIGRSFVVVGRIEPGMPFVAIEGMEMGRPPVVTGIIEERGPRLGRAGTAGNEYGRSLLVGLRTGRMVDVGASIVSGRVEAPLSRTAVRSLVGQALVVLG